MFLVSIIDILFYMPVIKDLIFDQLRDRLFLWNMKGNIVNPKFQIQLALTYAGFVNCSRMDKSNIDTCKGNYL